MRENTLNTLLGVFDPDEEAAAVAYQKLHTRLSRFFEWNDIDDPNALADEALDRLARRACDGDGKEELRDPVAFTLGIARLLVQEEARRDRKKIDALRQWAARTGPSDPDAEAMDKTLQNCLSKLQPDRRALVDRYYLHSGKKKIEIHRALAEEAGISINALRNRALRVRQELEACMRRHTKEASK